MSLASLQAWLMEEGIREDLDILTRATVTAELDNLVGEPIADVNELIEWPRVLLAASILTRSENRSHKEAALRIATAAVTLSNKPAIRDAGAVLLEKISNFRAAALARGRGYVQEGLESRLGVSLRIEAQRRQLVHSVLLDSTGEWIRVNDFQEEFWNRATDADWLSASAPTASGKTFLVLQWLVEQMRSSEARVAVYLAPTRALVSEIEGSLQALLGEQSSIEVSSLPLREKYTAARVGNARSILVYTQERLHLLANTLGGEIIVDLVVVDEAHKIGDNQRGIILQDAIERLERANPSLKVVFISPATQNPEALLEDAPGGSRTAAIDSDTPTVLQNLVLAEQVPRKATLWNLSVAREADGLPIGILQLGSSPAGVRKRIAFIAAAVGERGGTLVYANGAAEAEDIAGLISQLLPDIAPDPELVALADLARKTVHPQFNLAQVVERGVAFHYGNLPSLIRLEIERLFKSGKVRFLVCTSTLIEGVNLSCRTIVLRGPRKGLGNAMEPHDFWNLAGRAGRWGSEFQGNIVCIDPHDRVAWPHGVPSRARYSIKRESDIVLDKDDRIIEFLDKRASLDSTALEDMAEFENVGAYLLSTYLRAGSLKHANFAKRHAPATIEKLDASVGALATHLEIDAQLAARHPGVSAFGLQRLLDAFRAYEGDPENLLPASVDSQDSYDRFVTIMRRINENIYPAFYPDSLVRLHALIVVQWLRGFSLAAIIRGNINYQKERGRKFKLATLIRDTMEKIEQTARFRAPKYLSAYMDVLNLHLRQLGREDLVDEGLDIGTQLEFGVSSQTLLSLLELGLSRTSAVSLYEKIAKDGLTKPECIAWVAERNAQLDGLDLPLIVVREVREKLQITAPSHTRPAE